MKTILITGGNRGIGFEAGRQLDKLGHRVIIGSRDLEKGNKAVLDFSNNAIAKQLDVTDPESILDLVGFINDRYDKLDVLINNAGLGTNATETESCKTSSSKKFLKKNLGSAWEAAKKLKPLAEKLGISATEQTVKNVAMSHVKYIMETNFFGAWQMIQAFIPLLKKGDDSRIINVSSGLGQLVSLDAKYPAYRISKSSLNALTIMLSKDLEQKGININAMCPGWVRTDMGGPDAPRDVSEGADTMVWMATTNKLGSGKFYRDRKEINW